MLSPRAELIGIQKKIFESNRRLIRDSIRVAEPGFRGYERRYRSAVARYRHLSNHESLSRALQSADIIFVGDYHTCHQSQRSFLRILKSMRKKSRRSMVLCLELFHKSMQPMVDGYLSGRISEETFLKRVKLRERWVFNLWANFRPVMDFARYHHIPVIGTEVAREDASLITRDRLAGGYIADVAVKYPRHQLLVLIGDLHLAPSHLPLAVSMALKRSNTARKALTIYQNSDAIYWKLARLGLVEKVDVVQVRDDAYCLMHTPPIVCQQSYLNWLEHEEGEIDYADARHNFLELVGRIAHFLRIPLGDEKDDVEVYTCGDLSFLKSLGKEFSRPELRQIRQQILASESYFIPKKPLVYLANLSLNHAAEEASHFLKYLCTGEEEPRVRIDAFYANILHEALGFFGSKLINPKRKCFHLNEFRATLRYFKHHPIPRGRAMEVETAKLLLAYKLWEHRGAAPSATFVFNRPYPVFFALTHALGYMLGDLMFYGLMSNVIRKCDVRRLFMDRWKDAGAPYRAYIRMLSKLKSVKIPKRM